MNFSSDGADGGVDDGASRIDRNDSSLAITDDDGDPFWTREQLMMMEHFPPNAFVIMGLIVSVIGFFGLVANGTVLFIFSRFKRLRSPPANTFIINLALSDMGASALHSMAAYSNFNGRWAFGRLGCELYGMGVGFFGLVSILTFSAIACERCLVIACPSKPTIGFADGRWKVSRAQAKKACGLIWLHCGILVAMPFFGWSSYVPEGLLTSCSWDYTTRTTANRAYYILLLTTGFLLPVMLICASYGRIMASVLSHARQMVCVNKHSSAFRKLRRQTEIRTAQIVVTLIFVYLTAWTPYAIVTIIGQFGPEDEPLTPIATAIPAYFAKTAVVLDPLVYGFSHPHFRTSLRHYLANVTVAQNNKSVTSTQHHVGMSQVNSKSYVQSMGPGRQSCNYPSRGLAVYPSACCAVRICEAHAAARLSGGGNAGADGGNKRRMLRTFRDMSHDAASSVSTNTIYNVRSAGFRAGDIGSGVMELCHSYVAVVSIPLDKHAASASSNAGNAGQKPAIREEAIDAEGPTGPQSSRPSQTSYNFKYKVRNAEFHSEYGPSA